MMSSLLEAEGCREEDHGVDICAFVPSGPVTLSKLLNLLEPHSLICKVRIIMLTQKEVSTREIYGRCREHSIKV